MAGLSVRPGDPIPLVLQLHDKASSKFVRAVVRDATDAQVLGSPFYLSHVGDGLYRNYVALASPLSPFYVATYEVFRDLSFTQPDLFYSVSGDVFTVDIPDSRLQALDVNVSTRATPQDVAATLNTFRSDPLIGIVESQEDELVGVVEDD
jgi:hypothetical protein